MSDFRSQVRSARHKGRQWRVRRRMGIDPLTPPWRNVGAADHKYGRLMAWLRRLARELHAGALSASMQAFADHLHVVAVESWLLGLLWTWKRGPNGEFDPTPGKSGMKLSDLERDSGKWPRCRFLSRLASTGQFQPSPCRRIWLPKPGSHKRRPIDVAEPWDWLIEKAVAVTVSPLLTIQLTWSCIAFRKGIGHLHALAMAMNLTERHDLSTWLIVDLADAYGHVPHARLRSLLARLIPNERLVDLIMDLMAPERRVDGITGPRPRGIPQGSPLSPALFNAFLNHYLDEPWQKRFPQWPFLRYADDILILTRTRREAKAAHRALRRLLISAGFQIRDPKTRIANINTKTVTWLGHTITRTGGTFEIGIPEEHWSHWPGLKNTTQHKKETSTPETTAQSVSAFIAYHAPVWGPRDHNPAIHRLETLLTGTGMHSLLDSEDGHRLEETLIRTLDREFGRWTQIKCNVQLPMIGAFLPPNAGNGRRTLG